MTASNPNPASPSQLPPTPSLAEQSVSAAHVGNGALRFISPAADLASKGDVDEDSYFAFGTLQAEGRTLDVLIHYVRLRPPVQWGAPPFVQVMMSVLDREAGKSLVEEEVYGLDQTSLSCTELRLDTPTQRWSGTPDALRIGCDFATLKAELTLVQAGPALANLGTGLLPFYGEHNYQYSLPTMTASGSITIDGKRHEATGSFWFDRQWGPFGESLWRRFQWSWIGMVLDNGVRISLWDIVENGGSHAFATVLHPNGRHEIVDVEPLAIGASKHWTSPDTGNIYPTEWDVSIPQLQARLKVVPFVREQEIPSKLPSNHKYEGASSISGEILGQPVSGRGVVELVGEWK